MGAHLKYPKIEGESEDDRKRRLSRDASRRRMKTPEQRALWAARMREYTKLYPARIHAISVKARVKHRYGLTIEQLRSMFENQEGLCATCARLMCLCIGRRVKCRTRAHVDHDHITGKVRGMLCHDCNVAIGMMKDSPNRLRSAAQYLETEPSGPAYSCPS